MRIYTTEKYAQAIGGQMGGAGRHSSPVSSPSVEPSDPDARLDQQESEVFNDPNDPTSPQPPSAAGPTPSLPGAPKPLGAPAPLQPKPATPGLPGQPVAPRPPLGGPAGAPKPMPVTPRPMGAPNPMGTPIPMGASRPIGMESDHTQWGKPRQRPPMTPPFPR